METNVVDNRAEYFKALAIASAREDARDDCEKTFSKVAKPGEKMVMSITDSTQSVARYRARAAQNEKRVIYGAEDFIVDSVPYRVDSVPKDKYGEMVDMLLVLSEESQIILMNRSGQYLTPEVARRISQGTASAETSKPEFLVPVYILGAYDFAREKLAEMVRVEGDADDVIAQKVDAAVEELKIKENLLKYSVGEFQYNGGVDNQFPWKEIDEISKKGRPDFRADESEQGDMSIGEKLEAQADQLKNMGDQVEEILKQVRDLEAQARGTAAEEKRLNDEERERKVIEAAGGMKDKPQLVNFKPESRDDIEGIIDGLHDILKVWGVLSPQDIARFSALAKGAAAVVEFVADEKVQAKLQQFHEDAQTLLTGVLGDSFERIHDLVEKGLSGTEVPLLFKPEVSAEQQSGVVGQRMQELVARLQAIRVGK